VPRLDQLEEIRRAVGLSVHDLENGLDALSTADPPYLDYETASGWSDERAGGGYISDIFERARVELGAWPSPENFVEQLVAALERAAEDEPEPERKSKLHAAALVIGGMARDVAVSVTAAQLGRIG
jgi:hypothetical protein